MQHLHLDTREATRKLTDLTRGLSISEFRIAQSRAINHTLGKGRTMASRAIRSQYKMPVVYANKALKIVRSQTNRPIGYIKASSGMTPIHQFGARMFTDMGRTITLKKGVQVSTIRARQSLRIKERAKVNRVEVEVKKGSRQVINSAFFLRTGGGTVIAARGEYKKPTQFNFRTRRVSSTGSDLPIDVLQSVSPYKATINDKAQAEIYRELGPAYLSRLSHEIKYVISKRLS